MRQRRRRRSCCELLSKLSIFDTTNNYRPFCSLRSVVVNCFQNLVSLIRQTTFFTTELYKVCCELLSKLSIFDTTNNDVFAECNKPTVVNCFQNLVSLIRQTTPLVGTDASISCELLSKLSIFDTTNNLALSYSIVLYVVNCFQNLVSLIRQTTIKKVEEDQL